MTDKDLDRELDFRLKGWFVTTTGQRVLLSNISQDQIRKICDRKVERVIGEDEPDDIGMRNFYIEVRNELRAEQRQRLTNED